MLIIIKESGLKVFIFALLIGAFMTASITLCYFGTAKQNVKEWSIKGSEIAWEYNYPKSVIEVDTEIYGSFSVPLDKVYVMPSYEETLVLNWIEYDTLFGTKHEKEAVNFIITFMIGANDE